MCRARQRSHIGDLFHFTIDGIEIISYLTYLRLIMSSCLLLFVLFELRFVFIIITLITVNLQFILHSQFFYCFLHVTSIICDNQQNLLFINMPFLNSFFNLVHYHSSCMRMLDHVQIEQCMLRAVCISIVKKSRYTKKKSTEALFYPNVSCQCEHNALCQRFCK